MTIQIRTKIELALSAAALLTLGSATASTVIVEETFGGAGGALDSSTAETFDAGIGAAGGSSAWVSSDTFFDDGSVVVGTSAISSAYLNLGSYINDTKGSANGVFILTMTIGDVTGSGNTWLSMGFSALNEPSTTSHFLNQQGTGSIILRGSGELDMWGGPGGSVAIDGPDGNAGDRTLTVTVDLSDYNGVDNFGSVTWTDSQIAGVLASHDYASDVDFSSIYISEANGTLSTLSGLSLTQVPEPSSVALLGLGSLSMMFRRRK